MISLYRTKRYALRRLRFLGVFLIGVVSTAAEASEIQTGITWHVDYQEARRESSEKELPMLLFFSGSDWSGSCMRLKEEILSSADFSSKVRDKFVCVEVDFPKYNPLQASLAEQNATLRSDFQVECLPCLLLLSPSGREIYKLGSLGNESGDTLADSLCHFLEIDRDLQDVTPKISSLSMEDLQKYYHLAEELARTDFITQALEIGVSHDNEFFLIENFRLLVSQGEMDSENCQFTKERLLKTQSAETHFTIALVEFQELAKRAQEGRIQEIGQVIAPLQNYLSLFGEDLENKWRIEMMIAQFYLDFDQWKRALEHAEVAFEAAPTEVRSDISRSLDYIRHQG